MIMKYNVLILLFISQTIYGIDELSIDVAGRPLADSVLMLSEQLHTTITYEDAPVFGDDLRQLYNGFITKSREISYTYDPNEDPNLILEGLLDAHTQQGNPGVYSFSKKDGIFNVFPVYYRDQDGQNIAYEAVLDTEISLDVKDSNCYEVLDKVFKKLSDIYDNRRFVIPIPIKAMKSIPFSGSIDNKKARDVINDILKKFNTYYSSHPYTGEDVKWTWHLRYGPPFVSQIESWHAISFSKISIDQNYYNKIKVEHGRPVAAAVKILEKRYGCIINYEDPVYECPCDIVDEKTDYLAGGIIKIDWQKSETIEDLLNKLTQTIIAPRQEKDLFRWTKNEGRYYVYPIQSKDKNGNMVSRTSIVSQKISLDMQDTNSIDIFKSICSELSSVKGKKVELGTIPENLQVQLSNRAYSKCLIENENAIDILNHYLKESSPTISWQLLYQPSLKGYELNIYDAFE